MNSNLISKNISGYFDELINKPIINIQPKQSTFTSFYKNYVEHNLLLIIIIIFIILFLLLKYFSKNLDHDDETEKRDLNKIENEKIDRERKIREKKIRDKIKKERELLEKEKSEILSIIDELSEINYKSINKNKNEEITKQSTDSEQVNHNKIKYNNINFEAYTKNDNYSDDYYDINKNKSELIEGMYFETPYN
jgi:hypothetical protein